MLDNKTWEFYISRVQGKTYEEYRQDIGLDEKEEKEEEIPINIETTINNSRDIATGAAK